MKYFQLYVIAALTFCFLVVYGHNLLLQVKLDTVEDRVEFSQGVAMQGLFDNNNLKIRLDKCK